MGKIAFVCAGNAGRSQIATAYAEVERDRRGFGGDIEIVTGGTDPHDHVHETVVEVLAEDGIDISDRTPRKITAEDVADAEHIVTMGCSATEFTPDGWDGSAERWELEHPGGDSPHTVRQQRDEIRERVEAFFDRLED